MEENKLTDEEIAKAILQSIEYSKTITYFDEWGNCKAIMMTDILDLIHRLQSENERLSLIAGMVNKGVAVEIVNMQNTIDEQKAEIERLTAEIGQRRAMMGRMDCNYATELQKNEELQKQVEKLTEEKWKVQDDLDNCHAENTELQKQVDELTAFKNEAISMSLYGKGRKDGAEVAVKDTAKEILQGFDKWLKQAISDSYDKSVKGSIHYGGKNRAFHEVKELVKKVAESKGVEVE